MDFLNNLSLRVAGLAHQHPYLAAGASVFVAAITLSILKRFRRRHFTKLAGPPSTSFLLGHFIEVLQSDEQANLYADWATKYGPVYNVSAALGAQATVLCDPAAVASVLSRDTWAFRQAPSMSAFFEAYFGKNLLIVEGEDHKRQRRALSTGFSVAAIRNATPVFYRSVYTAIERWNAEIQSAKEGTATIDVQSWMNHITLDSIGNGGFSHDFGATRGKHSNVAEMFDAFADLETGFVQLFVFLVGPSYPALFQVPTVRKKVVTSLAASFEEIATTLLEKARKEKATGVNEGIDKSIIGALLRSETGSSNVRMNLEEIRAQASYLYHYQRMSSNRSHTDREFLYDLSQPLLILQQSLFMIAGYETTSITLTWALIELSRKPELQQKLRAELSQFGGEDPTFEQLGSDNLPYLDAVVHETLRLHPSLQEIQRKAVEDDVLPLSEPVKDLSGRDIDTLVVPKGADFIIPANAINRLELLWGANARTFDPERWINDSISSEKAAKIQSYHHLLTFADGPRTCLGRMFAVTQIKAVLGTLIRNYTFELPGGPDTKFQAHLGLLTRPKVAGEEKARVPLLVRKVDS